MPDATAASRFHGGRRTPSGPTTSSYRVASLPSVGWVSAATYSLRTGTAEILPCRSAPGSAHDPPQVQGARVVRAGRGGTGSPHRSDVDPAGGVAAGLEPRGPPGFGLVGIDRRVVVGTATGVDDVVRRAADAGPGR